MNEFEARLECLRLANGDVQTASKYADFVITGYRNSLGLSLQWVGKTSGEKISRAPKKIKK